jgi:ParB family chromosome partitioning protein
MSSVVQDAPTSVGPEFFYPDMAAGNLQPSALNPRKTFNPARLRELAASVAVVGVIEPLVARQVGDHYEIVCGERRWRAAEIAGLTHLPVMVRCLTDTQALEIMVVENKQREDVDALDEARGFRALLDTGYGIEKLAERIGLSKKYVYDAMKLLQLIPEVEQLLVEGRITKGHAILLARLKPRDQARAIDREERGLYYEDGLDDEIPSESEPYRGLQVVSVRELDAWIARNVRLDLSKPVESDDFPAVARAQEMAARVVSITYERVLPLDVSASHAAGDRILLADEWKRADGGTLLDAFNSRPVIYPGCTQSLLGVVVIGRDRGASFPVCIERSCDIHWKKERAEQARGPKGPESSDAAQRRREQEHQEWKQRQEREAAVREAYRAGAPRILAAFVACVKDARPVDLVDAIVTGAGFHPLALKAFPKVRTAEDLLRVIAVSFVAEGLQNDYSAPEQVPLWAKRLGVDLKPLLKPEEKSVQPSARKKASAKKAPAKGRR